MQTVLQSKPAGLQARDISRLLTLALVTPLVVLAVVLIGLQKWQLLFEHIRITALSLFFVLSTIGWGSLVIRRQEEKPIDMLALRAVFGLCVLFVTSIFLGIFGYFKPAPLRVIHTLGALIALLAIKSNWNFIRALIHKTSGWKRNEQYFFGLLLLLCGWQMLLALGPNIFIDTLTYHLYAPSEFLKHGNFLYLPWNVGTNTPISLQLVLGTSLVFDSSGQVFRFLVEAIGCLLPFAIFRFTSGYSISARILAGFFVLTFPTFWVSQSLGILDIMMVTLLLFGAAWFREALANQRRIPVLGAGLVFGLVVSSRYQTAILILVLIAAIFIERLLLSGKKDLRHAFFTILKIDVIMLIVFLPVFTRNMIHHGNAFFPLAYGLFGGRDWSSQQAAFVNSQALGPSWSELDGSQRLLAPWNLLLPNPWNGLYGVMLFFTAVIALFGARNSTARLTAVVGIGGLILWSAIHPTASPHLMRFNAGTIVFLMIACAGVLADSSFLGSAGFKAGLLIAAYSLLMSLVLLQERVPTWRTLIDPKARQIFFELNVPGWKAFDAANKMLDPARHKVLLIGESRGFFVHVPCINPSSFNGAQLQDLFAGSDPALWKRKLQIVGVTHLIVSRSEWIHNYRELQYSLNPEDVALNSWLNNLPTLFNDGHGNRLLQVR